MQLPRWIPSLGPSLVIRNRNYAAVHQQLQLLASDGALRSFNITRNITSQLLPIGTVFVILRHDARVPDSGLQRL